MRKRFQNVPGPSNHINRKIPFFPEAEVVAERLAATDEFQRAKNIKVNIDLAQEAVKLQALKAGKTLFVAPSQKSDYLYAKIKPCNVEEVPLVTQKRIVKMLGGEETYEELGIEQAEPLDMIVIGCVAVTELGQRIGKGNGYVDLEIAILVDLGVITSQTVIATTVADEQVYLPMASHIFQPYDFTVDLIVTPTRVIRVANRPEPRAIGVQWNLLSSRRLEVVRVLKKLKERLEAQGKHIELKDEDTDVESFRKTRNQRSGGGAREARGDGTVGGGERGAGAGGQRRQQNRRRRGAFGRSGGGGGAEGGEGGSHDQKEGGGGDKHHRGGGGGDGGAGSGEEGGGRMRRKRRYSRKPRQYQRRDSSEYNNGQHKDGEGGGQDGEGGGHHFDGNKDHSSGGGGRRRNNHRGGAGSGAGGEGGGVERGERGEQRDGEGGRPRRRPHHQHAAGVRIRVSNMFSVRFKDFKDELRARDCYPSKISKGRYGRCLLFFPKRGDDDVDQASELLEKLADMRITVGKDGGEPKQIELKCEVQPPKEDDDDDYEDGGGRRQGHGGHDDRSGGGDRDRNAAGSKTQQAHFDAPANSSTTGPANEENEASSKATYDTASDRGGLSQLIF